METKIRSLVLSTSRFGQEDEHDQRLSELERISAELESGLAYEYDSRELERLRNEIRTLDSVPMSAVWSALWVMFRPAVLILVVMLCILGALRCAAGEY